jgi:hypothetical protein
MDFKVQLKENAVVMRNELPCRICSMRVPLPPQFRRVKTAICPSCAHEGLDKIVTIRLFKEQIVASVHVALPIGIRQSILLRQCKM